MDVELEDHRKEGSELLWLFTDDMHRWIKAIKV